MNAYREPAPREPEAPPPWRHRLACWLGFHRGHIDNDGRHVWWQCERCPHRIVTLIPASLWPRKPRP